MAVVIRSTRNFVLYAMFIAVAAFGLGWLAGQHAPSVQNVSSAEARTNILLVGIGGSGHLGGNLADSIMIASVAPGSDKAVLLSVPRDLYIDINGLREARINAAHAIGEARYGDGVMLLRDTLEASLNIRIDHHVRVDFAAFTNTIDALGGIDVHFSEPLYDPFFKREYGVLDFAQGTHRLDGQAALYTARSRKTSKGGDFDRASRQRAILMAVKDKLLSMDVVTNPSIIKALLNAAGDNLKTDLSMFDAWQLYGQVRDVRRIESIGLGDVQGLLKAEKIGGADVLVPAAGDLTRIQSYVASLLDPRTQQAG